MVVRFTVCIPTDAIVKSHDAVRASKEKIFKKVAINVGNIFSTTLLYMFPSKFDIPAA